MTTGPKKGMYWYLALAATILLLPMSFGSLVVMKQNAFAGTFWDNWKEMISCAVIIAFNVSFLSDLFKYKEGYTTVTTTQYQLFKCRESGKDETFMMFADTEEELERFFEVTQPSKKFFIEPAEMTGKSVQMKIFHPIDEN